jgi:hypothetical protein
MPTKCAKIAMAKAKVYGLRLIGQGPSYARTREGGSLWEDGSSSVKETDVVTQADPRDCFEFGAW